MQGLLELLGLGGGQQMIPGPMAQPPQQPQGPQGPMYDQPQPRPSAMEMGQMGLMDFLHSGSGGMFGEPQANRGVPADYVDPMMVMGPGAGMAGQGIGGLLRALLMGGGGAPKKAAERTGKGLMGPGAYAEAATPMTDKSQGLLRLLQGL